jgi:hypothetical protein
MRPLVGGFAARASAAKRRALEALERPDVAERFLIDECVAPNVQSGFGREHGFSSIRSVEDFRRQVPIRDYDQFAPFIERIVAGERSILTGEDPIAFNRTSGTTGAAKHIPITQSYHARHELWRRMAFWGNVLELHPELAERDDSVLNFSFDRRVAPSRTVAGLPHVSISERTSASEGELEGQPGTAAPWSLVPEELTEHSERTYFRMRMAVEHPLRGLVCFNPSTLVVFAQELERSLPRVIAELRAGTVLGRPARAANPTRAHELETLARSREVLPRDVWPSLSVIVCWKAGACALYLPRLRTAYGDKVEILPSSVSGSEGPIAIPLDGHPTAGVLAAFTAFHEFVPADGEIGPGTATLLAGELEAGKSYQVVLTQSTGLYRYTAGDIVSVVEFVGRFPRVEFIRRRGAQSSFTGEKLTERHVVDAAGAALAALGLEAVNLTCCPIWGDPPHYTFVVEPVGVSNAPWGRLAAELDRQIALHNDEYPGKRSTGRLGPVQLYIVGPGSFAAYRSALIAAGAPPATLKDKALQSDGATLARLLALSPVPPIHVE